MPAPTSEDSPRTAAGDELAPQPAGIVERLVRDDHDRKRFLRMVGGAGAASFGAFVLAACGSSKSTSTGTAATATTSTGTTTTAATNPFGAGDIGILNYALTLEYLEAAFYNGASAANMALSSQAAAFLKVVTADENAHVKFLKSHLGSKAAKEPKFNFKGANTSPEMFMKTAQVLENTGVHAYSGQALNIKSAAYVKAAISILTIEARHASVIGLLNDPSGEMIAPDGPFDTPLTAAKVLAAVKETGFIL
jgi:hypothetical protein